jgi:hypothetical protein
MPTQASYTSDAYEVSQPSITGAAIRIDVDRRTIRSDSGFDVCFDRVQQAMVIPSFRCNARCEFCCNHLQPTDVAAANRELQLQRFERAIRTINPLLPSSCIYSISGGEVSMVPHLEDILLRMKAIGIGEIGIMTNGRMHERLLSIAPLVKVICISRHHPDAVENARFFGRERPWMSKGKLIEFAAAIKSTGSRFDINAMVAKGALDGERPIGDLVDLSMNVGVGYLRMFDPFIADISITPMARTYRRWYREHVIPDAPELVQRSLGAMGIEIKMHQRDRFGGPLTWGSYKKGQTEVTDHGASPVAS